jgi:hypothetical protein
VVVVVVPPTVGAACCQTRAPSPSYAYCALLVPAAFVQWMRRRSWSWVRDSPVGVELVHVSEP